MSPGTVQVRHAHGEGAVLEGEWAPFHDALARPAQRPGASSTEGDAVDAIPANAEGRPQPFHNAPRCQTATSRGA
jgi:hypothetical protein